MSRSTGKITEWIPAEARERRGQARAFIDVAEMVLTQSACRHEAHVAAALAVLAAIAAADAICGLTLHRYSRGQDHAQAAKLLEKVSLDDTTLPAKLRRVLASKDAVHYSPQLVTARDARNLLRLAQAMVVAAERL
jgi:hypothetical protein